MVSNCNWRYRGTTGRRPTRSACALGSPAMTTRGFGTTEFARVADWIARVVDSHFDDAVIADVARETRALCQGYALP